MSKIIEAINLKSNWIFIAMLVVLVFFLWRGKNQPSIEGSSDSDFQSAIASESRPVLVKFGATWCPPCISTDKALAEYERSSEARARVIVLDIDRYPELSQRYGVSSIPHSFLFKNGKVVEERVGGMDVGEIQQWVNSIVSK